jgi:hypothetical protein
MSTLAPLLLMSLLPERANVRCGFTRRTGFRFACRSTILARVKTPSTA